MEHGRRPRRHWLIAAGIVFLAVIVVAVWLTRERPPSSAPSPAPTTTPTGEPSTASTGEPTTAPPLARDDGVSLAAMSLTGTPITVQLPEHTQLKTADPLQPFVTLDFFGVKQVSEHLELTSAAFELRDHELHELTELQQQLDDRFANSDGTVICDMDVYDAVVLAQCRMPVTTQLSAVFFNVATGASFTIEDDQLLAATSLGADSHVAVFASAQAPQTAPAITVRHYAGDGTVRWSEEFLVADDQDLAQVRSQLHSWRLPPAHLLIPTVTGGEDAPWKIVDLRDQQLLALADAHADAQIAQWPGMGGLLVTCPRDDTAPRIVQLGADFRETDDATLPLHALQGVSAPLGLQWCEADVAEDLEQSFIRAATAVPFADLQAALPKFAALGKAGSLDGEAGEQFVLQILPGGEVLSAPVDRPDYPMKAALPADFASVTETCDVPSVLIQEGQVLLCIDNDFGERAFLGYQADSPTPLFSLPIEPGVDPSWVRVGTDIWLLNAGGQLYLIA